MFDLPALLTLWLWTAFRTYRISPAHVAGREKKERPQ